MLSPFVLATKALYFDRINRINWIFILSILLSCLMFLILIWLLVVPSPANAAGTELPYWIESGMNTASTKIWVNVDSIPAPPEAQPRSISITESAAYSDAYANNEDSALEEENTKNIFA